ncbi:MAG: hypothetical protein CL878_04185 [Dehalococcoidia bacterium]|nr:hypothetical protein [Dehalococcoidia bacterium]
MTTSTSAASKVDVHTRPNANQVAVGEIIEVQVRLANPDALPIDAVELLLQFDPAVLQVVDTAGQPATKVDASAIAVAWQVPLQNSVDNERGQVSLAFGADLAGAAVDGDELHVATLRLHAIAPSTSTALAWLRTEIASRGNSVPPRPLRSR